MSPVAMNPTDYLVIAAIIISAVVGALRGFLREAVALAAWIIALFVAWHFSDLIEPHLGGLIGRLRRCSPGRRASSSSC